MNGSHTAQIRHDPITGRPVLIAPERAARPGALTPAAGALPDDTADCPLCEGRESRTPPELLADRPTGPADAAGWRVRVVPNRYPAVRGELGAHELLVECPNHEPSLERLTQDQICAVLAMYRQRLLARAAEGRWQYGMLFKNHGLAAGASLAHAHSQLIALPDVPPMLNAELSACANSCGFCRFLESELADGTRVIRSTRRFVALTAFAGRLPFESWLLPREHHASFERTTDGEMTEFCELLADVLSRLAATADRPAYNLYLHNAPWPARPFHWHFELVPRLTGIAGFELGAGMFINPLAPEDAAGRLRECRPHQCQLG